MDDLRQSVDENHTKFEQRHEETSITANRNWENIELIWDEIRKMQVLDDSNKDEESDRRPVNDKAGPKYTELEKRVTDLEHQKATIKIEEVVYLNKMAIEDLKRNMQTILSRGNSDFDAAAFQKRI